MDLVLLARTLWKRKWILIGVPLLATVLAVYLTKDLKKSYRSVAQIETGFTINEQVSLKEERFNYWETQLKFDNLIATISSQLIYGMLSYKVMLHDLDPNNVPFRTLEKPEDRQRVDIDDEAIKTILTNKLDSVKLLSASDPVEKKILELLRLYEYDYRALESNLNVARLKTTDFVSVIALSDNPSLSAYLVNSLCDIFLDYNKSKRSSRSTESVAIFSRLVEQKRTELNDKSSQLKRYKSIRGLVNVEVESTNKIGKVSELETERADENRKLRAALLELDNVKQRIGELGSNSSGLTANQRNLKIIDLRSKITRLNSRYQASGSNNQVLKDSLDTYRNELQAVLSTPVSGGPTDEDQVETLQEYQDRKNQLEIDVDIARQNVASIDSTLSLVKRDVGGFANIEAEIVDLEREVDLASKEYLDAQTKYNEALDVASSTETSLRQLLEGQPAVDPEPSKRLIISGLSGVTTFVICLIAIILLEYLDISIKTPSNFAKATHLRLIGVLNHLSKKNQAPPAKNGKAAKKPKEVESFQSQLRKIRFEIEKSGKRIFLFTSCGPQAGKSLVLQAIAQSFTLSKKKILLIDFNLANNGITQTMGAQPILEEYTTGNVNKPFQSIISNSKNKNIDVIGCKGGPYSPSEILRKNLGDDLKAALDTYDYIFIEGASLNEYSDSKELSEYADGIIAVFSAKSTLSQSDQESINYLNELNGQFVGAVLTDLDLRNVNL